MQNSKKSKIEVYKPPADQYQGIELQPYDGRPGCNAALDCPSRIGNYLYHRDGRVVVEQQKESNV